MNYYKVDQKYKFSNRKGNNDQFLDWFNDRTNVSVKNMGGIRWRAFRYENLASLQLPSLILLFEILTNKGSNENPWIDATFNVENGQLIYPGDAKKTSKWLKKEEFAGNKIFLNCAKALNQGRKQQVPPVLYFVTHLEGWSQFKGLFQFKSLETYFDHKAEVNNFKYHCQKIDIDEVPVNWLRDRALCENLSALDEYAPSQWKNRFKIIQFEELRVQR